MPDRLRARPAPSVVGPASAGHPAVRRPVPADQLPVWAARIVGAGLLAGMAGIHLYLWRTGYRTIPIIGPLFVVNGVVGALLALAVLGSPRRRLLWVSAAGAGLAAGTLLGLAASLTVGLFGFAESTQAPLVGPTIATEVAGFVVLGALAAYDGVPALRRRR